MSTWIKRVLIILVVAGGMLSLTSDQAEARRRRGRCCNVSFSSWNYGGGYGGACCGAGFYGAGYGGGCCGAGYGAGYGGACCGTTTAVAYPVSTVGTSLCCY